MFRAAHAVSGGGQDASGIPGPFAAGVKPADIALIRFVPPDAHGRGGTALHRRQQRVGDGVAPDLPLQQRQCLGDAVHHKGRQAAVQVGIRHAGPVAGRHAARRRGGTAQQEVLHPLAGRAVVPAAQGIGRLLDLPLEPDARQRIVPAAVILRRHVDQQRAVDVLLITGILAHAVGDHAARLRSGGHHLPAGADAEGKGTAAIVQMAG